MARDYPNPLNMPKAARRKLEYLCKKRVCRSIQQLLLNICMQMTDILDKANALAAEGGEKDPSTFHELLNFCVLPGREGEEDRKMKTDGKHDVGIVQLLQKVTGVAAATAENEFEPVKKVTATNCAILNIYGERSLGACVESGAELTVIENAQTEVYAREYGGSMVERESQRLFKSGDGRHRDIGRLNIRMTVSRSYYCKLSAEVIDIGVPLLLGLDALLDMKVVSDFYADRIVSKHDR